MYTYGGMIKGGQGITHSFPGPAFDVTTQVPANVRYVNNIDGPHILPLDYSHDFPSTDPFINEVPTIPHLHGAVSDGGSDGYPTAWWSKSGARGSAFETLDNTLPSN